VEAPARVLLDAMRAARAETAAAIRDGRISQNDDLSELAAGGS
jgi:hypothetical protein